MADTVPARLTPAEGRKFGLTVGGAFLAIALFLWWRGRASFPWVGGVGALLALAGLLVPTYLGPVHKAWMGLAHLLSKVTTPIFMGLVYFLVLTPIGIAMRLAGRRPLRHRLAEGAYWKKREGQAGDLARQF